MQELEVLKSLDHKHIVKVTDYIDDPKSSKVHLVLEYLSGGSV